MAEGQYPSGSRGIRLSDLRDEAGCIGSDRVEWLAGENEFYTEINRSRLSARQISPKYWQGFIGASPAGDPADNPQDVMVGLLERAAFGS